MKKLFLIFFCFSMFSNLCKAGPDDLTPEQIEKFIEFIDKFPDLGIMFFVGVQPSVNPADLTVAPEALFYQMEHAEITDEQRYDSSTSIEKWIKLANVGTLFQIFNYLMTDGLIENSSFDRQVQEPRNQILENASVFSFCYLILAMAILNGTRLSPNIKVKKEELFNLINLVFVQNGNFKNFMEYLCSFFFKKINLQPFPLHLLSKTILIISLSQKEIFPFQTLEKFLNEELIALAQEAFNVSCQEIFSIKVNDHIMSPASISPSNYSLASSFDKYGTEEYLSDYNPTPKKPLSENQTLSREEKKTIEFFLHGRSRTRSSSSKKRSLTQPPLTERLKELLFLDTKQIF